MAKETKIRMNVDNWTYQDFNDFLEAMQVNDLDIAHRLAEQIIVQWDYPVDLSQPNPLNKLSFEDGGAALHAVLNTVNTNAENIDTSDVILDFRKWDTGRFIEFTKARKAGKVAVVEKMMREVALMPGMSEDEDAQLTYTQGAAMMRAIRDKYNRILQVKN